MNFQIWEHTSALIGFKDRKQMVIVDKKQDKPFYILRKKIIVAKELGGS